MMLNTSGRIISGSLVMLLTAAGAGFRTDPPPVGTALSAADVAGIRATIEAYRTSWLAADNEGVLKTLTEDGVLLPHHGDPPVIGRAAMRAHWFPPGPPTTIEALTITIEQIAGHGTVAYVWGHDTVRWSTTADGVVARFTNTGTYLNVMAKGTDGAWQICAHMWDDPATQRVTTP